MTLDSKLLTTTVSEDHATAILRQASERALQRAAETGGQLTLRNVRDAAIEADIPAEDIDAVLRGYLKPLLSERKPVLQTNTVEALFEHKARHIEEKIAGVIAGLPVGYETEEIVPIDETSRLRYNTTVTECGDWKSLNRKLLTMKVTLQKRSNERVNGYQGRQLFELTAVDEGQRPQQQYMQQENTVDEHKASLIERIKMAYSVLIHGPENIVPPPKLIVAVTPEEPPVSCWPPSITVTVPGYYSTNLRGFLNEQVGKVDTSEKSRVIAYALSHINAVLDKDQSDTVQKINGTK